MGWGDSFYREVTSKEILMKSFAALIALSFACVGFASATMKEAPPKVDTKDWKRSASTYCWSDGSTSVSETLLLYAPTTVDDTLSRIDRQVVNGQVLSERHYERQNRRVLTNKNFLKVERGWIKFDIPAENDAFSKAYAETRKALAKGISIEMVTCKK